MVPRYANPKVTENSSDINKLNMWQKVELAVISAREKLGIFLQGIHEKINNTLDLHLIDEEAVKWWKAKDKEIGHDLNAFIDERLRHLFNEFHQYFHKGMTSYDTEEPAFSLILLDNIALVENEIEAFLLILKEMAKKYRYTPMLGRTHGQEAKMQSFGKRVFTWLQKLVIAHDELRNAKRWIYFSKLSGAIGNYQGLDEVEEAMALGMLGLLPFKGATQIMPRQLHQPLANALVMVVSVLTQIAEDIRLAARSGLPILQEPFGKKQKGSSAMPHKKNTITCENQIGMFTMAKGFARMIQDCLITWEERSIEQSCVERVAWPDLFHVVMQSFKNMKKVVEGLQVFPDNMMIEIINSRGCYASEDAKDWLKEKVAEYGLRHEDAYRMVQLAAFNCHQVSLYRMNIRTHPIPSLSFAAGLYGTLQQQLRHVDNDVTLGEIIKNAKLVASEELETSAEQVASWNNVLARIFEDKKNCAEFDELFTIAYQLRGEDTLFEELK